MLESEHFTVSFFSVGDQIGGSGQLSVCPLSKNKTNDQTNDHDRVPVAVVKWDRERRGIRYSRT